MIRLMIPMRIANNPVMNLAITPNLLSFSSEKESDNLPVPNTIKVIDNNIMMPNKATVEKTKIIMENKIMTRPEIMLNIFVYFSSEIATHLIN